MTHYVLLKFTDDTDKDAAERLVRDTYASLDRELSYLHDPAVYRNIVDRDSNADIMAVIRLDGQEYLKPYLTHPLHMNMANELKESIVSRVSFDHE